MIFMESLQRPSEAFTADDLGALHMMNMPMEERLALGIAKARQIRGYARRDALSEVHRLNTFGEQVYSPDGYVFSIKSTDGILEMGGMGGTNSNELGYSLELIEVASKDGDEPLVFIADRIKANPKESIMPGVAFAYSPYFPYQRAKVDSDRYEIDLISIDNIAGNVINPAPPIAKWLRYSNPWKDC
jgi:hypothetical protein